MLLVGVGKDHSWRLEQPLSWFPGSSGTWVRRTNATKFRQWSFIELEHPTTGAVARLKEFPYRFAEQFEAATCSHLWFFVGPGVPFTVEVRGCPPAQKAFRIRETWGASVSYAVVQGETITFEILDPGTNQVATYTYKGMGVSVGVPKLPSLPSGSSKGPWNDFTAPGWMGIDDFGGDATLQAPYNVGLGTSLSMNVFEFCGHVDNRPGYLVRIESFNTGRTYGLPSTGLTSGTMELASKGAQYTPN
jgi:hypothetical protein